jgi:broad specificity phosphatase PhoE
VQRVELRRHSVRDKPAEGLSPGGRALAWEEGARTGPFDLVISSPMLRAVETATAMGFGRPRIDGRWRELGPKTVEELGWPASFDHCQEVLEEGRSALHKAVELVDALLEHLEEVPEGGGLLVVTHGGMPELVSVRLLPRADARVWGGALRCMEGVRISIEAGRAKGIEVLRVPDAKTRM